MSADRSCERHPVDRGREAFCAEVTGERPAAYVHAPRDATDALCDVADLTRRHPSPPTVRSVLTRAHRIRISTRDLAERVERLVPGSLCRTMIPEDARVVDSPDFGLPVTLSHRRCRASVAYRELVEELYPMLNGAGHASNAEDEVRAVPAYGG